MSLPTARCERCSAIMRRGVHRNDISSPIPGQSVPLDNGNPNFSFEFEFQTLQPCNHGGNRCVAVKGKYDAIMYTTITTNDSMPAYQPAFR